MAQLPLRFVGVLVLIVASKAAAIDRTRVESANGAPRIVVDGQPVRARMFWGGPGNRPVHVGDKGQTVTFEFSPALDAAGHGTMHFRFGPHPGVIDIDEIHITDVDGNRPVLDCDFETSNSFKREWRTWPTSAANTVGEFGVVDGAGRNASKGLQVKLTPPPSGPWPDFHIYHEQNLDLRAGHRYRVSVWMRAAPARDVSVAFYLPGKMYQYLGGPGDVFDSQIKLAAQAGVQFITFPMDMPWPEEGEADWAQVDANCQTVLRANPDAWLLPRINVNAPQWWLAAHPNEAMKWDDARPHQPHAVPASPVYRHDCAEHLAALVEHLESKFGKHIAGYHPAGQNTDEWFYVDTWKPGLNGYSDADRLGFVRWLTEKYKTDSALQSAWHDAKVTLGTAVVPSPQRRRASPAGAFRDGDTERDIIDFSDYQQAAMAECVTTLAHAVRTASHGNKLVVFFYGYQFEFSSVHNGPATSGHYALRQLLDCPDIDIICSPISYFDRGLGQSAPAMTAAESVALAGKMWLYEDDTHTYLATGDPPGSRDHVDTLEKTNNELLRNTGQCALRNFGTWWMDLGRTGWFDDPRMWQQMKLLEQIDNEMLRHPHAFTPEIAAVVDPRSMLLVTPAGSTASWQSVGRAREALGRVGAPYGQYLLDDILAGRVKAKLYVFLNAWRLSESDLQKLQAATRGAGRVWCYTPGYLDENVHRSLDFVHKTTGFAVKEFAGKPLATPTEIGKHLGLTQPIGFEQPVHPLLSLIASNDQTLATYSDGTPAVALHQDATGSDLFVAPPGLTSELLRVAARQSGVHLFTTTDCNVYANGPFVVVHAAEDGEIELDTGKLGPIVNALDDSPVGDGRRLTLKLAKGQTRMLREAGE
jgi:hypothetical protein